ncbi:MAG: helix-turn-helix transcriptional regulator [Microbacterium ginsengisoli]|uniref:winged helix-turn-helix transcriptional regulator n=1 Tax=Microbacterium TaxID=33882 RepID=UPI0006FDFEC4|nr:MULTISPECIES: helix-turn-helix domain-containing protein [Microbacterium]MBN9197220.1 helix-turn-helix transcriptional regulator [Microbacterium ginsengisoli]ODU52138.1 MAG: HxlR family transcriptional regulator [Microbacterium sp. SCN 70-10]KQR92942.1 HxlR family transcriptional regulator [Microbacterium sp. Leaf351]KQS05688.1 HxlR family transcriptional regulator [Microbacterium sp. Leaf347]KXC07219.1 HxlR family transcriptional regulator [Microbacterium hominis]
MALRSDWSGQSCPIARGIDVLGDPWTLLILRESLGGARRFDEFKDVLGPADNILANRLKRMVEAGLLEKRPYTEGARPRHDYLPTQAAADALPILHALAKWGERHTEAGAGGGIEIICRSCGEQSTTGERCSSCGAPLVTSNVTWVRSGRGPVDLVDMA